MSFVLWFVIVIVIIIALLVAPVAIYIFVTHVIVIISKVIKDWSFIIIIVASIMMKKESVDLISQFEEDPSLCMKRDDPDLRP